MQSMANTQNIAKLANRLIAKRAAISAGKNWKDLSREEKSAQIRAARGTATKNDRAKAIVLLAKKEAKKRNLVWKEISKEERQSMIKHLRSGE